ncbi:MAG: DinB family protein [Vicinamibacterales bacterium]
MADVNTALEGNRDAIRDLVAAAERSRDVWGVPRAAGKWSPSQLIEHVARSLEEAANVVSGAPAALPRLPAFLRPLARVLVFKRVLRKGTFPKSKATKATDPISGPSTAADARARLETALAKFEDECRSCAKADRSVKSDAFGTVSLVDYARFAEVHTRHHCRQLK